MYTLKATLALTLAVLAAASPTLTTRGNNGPIYYNLIGYDAQTTDSHFLSIINNQTMFPYYESFWFGLPRDHQCKSPQPGEGTNFSCNTNSFKPLYTIDEELELATSYVTNRVLRAESGQVTYAYGSAAGGWRLTSDNILTYQGDSTFYACPETRGDAGLAYQVWQGTYDGKGEECVRMELKAEEASEEEAMVLPYGYGGN